MKHTIAVLALIAASCYPAMRVTVLDLLKDK